jgi:molecular chaperone HtpG
MANARDGVSRDEVLDLTFFRINDRCQQMIAYGWYADTNLSGTLLDERISGVRVRQGNILIGSQSTLASYFKERRFNGWVMGEVYVLSPNLIPNARRDDFEKNDTFSEFTIGLRATVGTEIANKIRTASKVRNNPMQKTLKKVERDLVKVEEVLATGFNSSAEKEQVTAGIVKTRKDLYAIPKNAPSEVVEQKTALVDRLKMLSDKIDESTNFKVKNDILSNFSKAEKKVIKAMMEVLTRNFERMTVDSLYREFIEELTTRGRKE